MNEKSIMRGNPNRFIAGKSMSITSHVRHHAFALSAVLVLGACAQNGVDESLSTAGATSCPDPRPEVCTLEYRPVCGTLKDGSDSTYANGCGACADVNVMSWTDGACPE